MVHFVVPGHAVQKRGCCNATGPSHAWFCMVSSSLIFETIVDQSVCNCFDEVLESEELLGILDRVWFTDFINGSEP